MMATLFLWGEVQGDQWSGFLAALLLGLCGLLPMGVALANPHLRRPLYCLALGYFTAGVVFIVAGIIPLWRGGEPPSLLLASWVVPRGIEAISFLGAVAVAPMRLGVVSSALYPAFMVMLGFAAAAWLPVNSGWVQQLFLDKLLIGLLLVDLLLLHRFRHLFPTEVQRLLGAALAWQTSGALAPLLFWVAPGLQVTLSAAFHGLGIWYMVLAVFKGGLLSPHTDKEGYRSFFAQAPDAMMILEPEGSLLEANEAAASLTGFAHADLVRRSLYDITPPSEHDTLSLLLQRVRQGFRALDEQVLLHKNGSKVAVEISATTLMAEERQLIMAVAREVTQRKHAEELVRQRELRSRAIFENGGIGTAVLTPGGLIVEANRVLCELTGRGVEELISTPFLSLISDPLSFDALADGEHYSGRHLLSRSDRTLWVDLTVAPVRTHDPSHDFVIATLVDVTLAYQAEQQRLRHEEALERAGLAKTRFIAHASHDIRQPLQAALLISSVLVEQPLPESSREMAIRIREALHNLSDMVNSLLDISKLDAGLVVPEKGAVHLERLLRIIEHECAPIAQAKGLDFIIEPLPEELWLQTDRNLLLRIIRNLVSNALRYTLEGGVTLLCRREGTEAVVEVADTGIGIREEDFGRIFDEFQQIGNVARNRREGMGLGLAIVAHLVRLLGLRVEVQSEINIGSLFSVWIPIAEGQSPKGWPTQFAPLPSAISALIIEDDGDIREGLSRFLASLGYRVWSAHDWACAQQSVESGRSPRLIIADYRLPDGNGVEAVRALREACGQPIPAVILTGDTNGSVQAEVTAAHCEVLFKPATNEQLKQAIATAMELMTKPPPLEDADGDPVPDPAPDR